MKNSHLVVALFFVAIISFGQNSLAIKELFTMREHAQFYKNAKNCYLVNFEQKGLSVKLEIPRLVEIFNNPNAVNRFIHKRNFLKPLDSLNQNTALYGTDLDEDCLLIINVLRSYERQKAEFIENPILRTLENISGLYTSPSFIFQFVRNRFEAICIRNWLKKGIGKNQSLFEALAFSFHHFGF